MRQTLARIGGVGCWFTLNHLSLVRLFNGYALIILDALETSHASGPAVLSCFRKLNCGGSSVTFDSYENSCVKCLFLTHPSRF